MTLFQITFDPLTLRGWSQFIKCKPAQRQSLIVAAPPAAAPTPVIKSDEKSTSWISFHPQNMLRLKSLLRRKKLEVPQEPEDYTLPVFEFDHRLSMVIDIDGPEHTENSWLPVEYLVKSGDGHFVRVLGTNQKTVAQNIAEMAMDELKRMGVSVESVSVNYANGEIFNGGSQKVARVPVPGVKPDVMNEPTPVTTPIDEQCNYSFSDDTRSTVDVRGYAEK